MTKFSILFHPVAEHKFKDAFKWYEESLPGLGMRFVDAVDSKMKK